MNLKFNSLGKRAPKMTAALYAAAADLYSTRVASFHPLHAPVQWNGVVFNLSQFSKGFGYMHNPIMFLLLAPVQWIGVCNCSLNFRKDYIRNPITLSLFPSLTSKFDGPVCFSAFWERIRTSGLPPVHRTTR